jgi:putative membrane protein
VIGELAHHLILMPLLFRHWFIHPGWFIGLGALLWLVMVVLIAVVVVTLLRRDRRPSTSGPQAGSPSLAILEERYARGEISRDEFIERRRVLMGWEPGDSTTPIPPAGGPS